MSSTIHIRLIPPRRLSPLFSRTRARLLVSPRKLPFAHVERSFQVRIVGRANGIVGGDVRVSQGIAGFRGRVQAVELGGDGVVAGAVEEAGDGGGVGFADGFAVPACALGVDFVEGLLVGFAGPLERGGEFVLVDFVVVVDEDAGSGRGVVVVGLGAQLVRVPGIPLVKADGQ